MTQEELADAVNVTRQTIISLENGKYKASLILAHKISQYFGRIMYSALYIQSIVCFTINVKYILHI